uniref:AAA+ ATPase domain-containing protein n=1 Tax=Megaselia scalaris TaxID=36166 RepID=T1GB56_MEGSC
RPKKVDDVVEQGEVVAVLRKSLEGADLPNLLLYGPPGTGKTSTILAAARQLFGDMYKERILELNASDERGIDVVRSKIKNFAQLTASRVTPDGKPCPPFKIIILDEADSMTHAAQAALRRTMEKESRSTREERIAERLRLIAKEENVIIGDEALKVMIDISGGDLRRAITTLQSCYRLKNQEEITSNDLLEMSGIIPEHYLKEFFDVCGSGDFSNLENFVQKLSFEAYSIGQMLDQFNEYILFSKDVTSKQKAIICDKLGECSFRLQDGGSEYLQILDLGCTIILTLQNK